jgi:hypothetical protein
MTSSESGSITYRVWVGICTIVVGLIVTAFGIQQHFYQKDASRRDACYATWGQGVIDTVNARTQAQKDVDRIRQKGDEAIAKVNQRHDAALDPIILDFLGLRQDPPTDTLRDVDRDLVRFSKAKVKADARLARATRDTKQALEELNRTRAQNPYPPLNCG